VSTLPESTKRYWYATFGRQVDRKAFVVAAKKSIEDAMRHQTDSHIVLGMASLRTVYITAIAQNIISTQLA